MKVNLMLKKSTSLKAQKLSSKQVVLQTLGQYDTYCLVTEKLTSFLQLGFSITNAFLDRKFKQAIHCFRSLPTSR